MDAVSLSCSGWRGALRGHQVQVDVCVVVRSDLLRWDHSCSVQSEPGEIDWRKCRSQPYLVCAVFPHQTGWLQCSPVEAAPVTPKT